MIAKHLEDYLFYAKNFQFIKTKMDGMQPFALRKYQLKFNELWQSIDDSKQPCRIVVLKPRQAGFSTMVASKFSHRMQTQGHYNVLMLADKSGRTETVADIYRTFAEQTDVNIKPVIGKNNTEELLYERIKSGIKYETANDPNAGKSGTRKGAHLTEFAFYRYSKEIDESVQNSIPLMPGTAIIKESTANGRAGIGRAFHVLWQAAKRGDSIYQPFFVAWYEVDDYILDPERGFRPTKTELDILKRAPSVTHANLMWRRLKIKEYLDEEEEAFLLPEERFCQDFPITDEEAFLSTGSPIFPVHLVSKLINRLNACRPNDIKDQLNINSEILKQLWKELKIYSPPRMYKQYYVGADVAEGVEGGDSSSVYIMDEDYRQVARWHGKIDPDLFGHVLIALGTYYNDALLIPECNNMGHTTITTIKNEGYPFLYRREIEDEMAEKKKVIKYGYQTNVKSKMDMINEGIARFRDGDSNILDVRLPTEMGQVARENGKINLNGRDRVVAYCLACMGAKHFKAQIRILPKKLSKENATGGEMEEIWAREKKRSEDLFD